MRKVLIISRFLGMPSEVWIYRHATGMSRYKSFMAVNKHFNADIFPYPHVHTFLPQNKINLLFKQLIFFLCHFKLPHKESLKPLAIKKLCSHIKPDIIHIHFLWNGNYVAQLDTLAVPFVVTAHGTDVNRAIINKEYRASLKKVFHRANKIIAVSKFISLQLQEIGCPSSKITVIPLGAPVPILTRDRAPYSDKRINILCVASLRDVKGHKYLLKALSIALKQVPELHVTLVGGGEEYEKIINTIDDLALRGNVELKGTLSPNDVRKEYIKAHIYAQHSVKIYNPSAVEKLREEGLPVTFVEAASYGLPLIGTRSGGIPEICRDQENGFVVDERDFEAMADKMILLARQPQLRKKLGKNGRELVEKEYNSTIQTSRLESLYDSIIHNSSLTN